MVKFQFLPKDRDFKNKIFFLPFYFFFSIQTNVILILISFSSNFKFKSCIILINSIVIFKTAIIPIIRLNCKVNKIILTALGPTQKFDGSLYSTC